MAGPFDDQLVVDMLESVTLTTLAGSSSTIAGVSVDEVGTQTVIAGLLSLVSRDYLITMGLTQRPTRPEEGASITLTADSAQSGEGLLVIVGVIYRKLGKFWEITARSYSVPGGLTERGWLQRRNSTPVTSTGLNSPTWSNLESNVPCRLMFDAQGPDFASTPVDSMVSAVVYLQGYREIRAGDRFYVATAPTVYWNVDGAEPYDPSLGVQAIRISKRK